MQAKMPTAGVCVCVCVRVCTHLWSYTIIAKLCYYLLIYHQSESINGSFFSFQLIMLTLSPTKKVRDP